MSRPKRPLYFGEGTKDNTDITPAQLMVMAQESLDEVPATGAYIVLVREGPDGRLDFDTFRCGLPLFAEIVFLAKKYQEALDRA